MFIYPTFSALAKNKYEATESSKTRPTGNRTSPIAFLVYTLFQTAAPSFAKQSIKAFQKLGKTEVMQGLKKQAVNTNKFIKEAAKTVKTEFLKSDAYKTPKAKLNKFATTKVGKPITKFFKAIGTGISTVYGKIKTGTNYIITKIKGVKKETYEKATVNTVGASGGIASGVTALKEKEEKGRED